METKEYSQEEVSDLKKFKWIVEDIVGLKIHGFIAWASSDPEIKQLHKEMEKAIMEEGDQPKALKIGQEIKNKMILNTHKRAERIGK